MTDNGTSERGASVPRWEYYFLVYGPKEAKDSAQSGLTLNHRFGKLGDSGWELAGVNPEIALYIFKREKR